MPSKTKKEDIKFSTVHKLCDDIVLNTHICIEGAHHEGNDDQLRRIYKRLSHVNMHLLDILDNIWDIKGYPQSKNSTEVHKI